MTTDELLALASRFTIGSLPNDMSVDVLRHEQPDGSFKWAVYYGEHTVFNKSSKKFERNKQPSSRSDTWYRTHRFNFLEEALKTATSEFHKMKAEWDKNFLN